jgi:type I restriction-modification system DNA methylase subunit
MKEKSESLTKSKARVKELGEVFTPAALVSEMLDKLPPDSWLPDKTFLEPSCGTGNFLVQILQRKLAAGHPPLQALATIYGIDIMKDNIQTARGRLLEMCPVPGASDILHKNIVVGDALAQNSSTLFEDGV